MKKINFAVAAATTVAMLSAATPALAYNGGWGNNWNQNDSDTTISNTSTIGVSNTNVATVNNATVAGSNTGGNVAAGGTGGTGGSAAGEGNANGGNGGMGGDAGIDTGVAVSSAGTMNVVNTNIVEIDSDCGCDTLGDLEEEGDTSITNNSTIGVVNTNVGAVNNITGAGSNTGLNAAVGGAAGNGGAATSDEDNNNNWNWNHHNWNNNDDESEANGGEGGNGGTSVVLTGDAGSEAGTVNVVNTNFVRISKGFSL